jgi:hypothetical protein
VLNQSIFIVRHFRPVSAIVLYVLVFMFLDSRLEDKRL